MATQRVERRLSAILAADIVGYSRLVERDEAGTLGTIKGIRETAEPDLSDELLRWSKVEGVFVLPQAASEATPWRGHLAKAGIPRCATSEQLDGFSMTPLPECDGERATQRAAAP